MAVLGILGIIIIFFLFSFAYNSFNWTKKDYENEEPQEDYYVIDDFPDQVEVTVLQKEIYNYLLLAKRATFRQLELATDCEQKDVDNLVFLGVLKLVEVQSTIKQKKLINIGIGIAVIIGIALAFYAANYYLMVRINLRYVGILFYGGLFIVLATAYFGKFVQMRQKDLLFVTFGVTGLVMLTVIFYIIFGGRTYFHAQAYSELITVSSETFSSDVKTVNVNTLPIVDKAYGEKLGSLKLGEYPGIGSEFEAGEYSDIIYNGEQYLVAPLEYRGIFKWFNNNDIGTPGYIMINKVTADTTLVNLRETDGQGMIYTPSAFFGQDLVRYAYFNGMYQYRLEQQFFEIDDDGNPYYVLQYSVPTIFINGGRDIVKVAVVNAITGEIGIYDPDDVPSWVESVYAPDLLLTQLNYWGSLQDGWINSIFTQRGVLQPSNGKRTIMNDGELYYFTGLTSAGSDESTIGFVYMNTRTKETKLYEFPGATEQAAMNKALTLLPQNNISTSFPIPINVNDTPTYFIAIKGEDGRILRHVFMSVQELEVNGMGETKAKAYTAYLQRLGSTSTSDLVEISGPLTDRTSYVLEGNTIYWIEIDDDEWYIVDVSSFDNTDMMYFISLEIGDTFTGNVQGNTVIEMNLEE
ncbi:hypothetical protein [Candidatus Xianfuyuplasma coldseepsis]|uniref:Uncharacterized protein n=1 Tax=Candidatus Xianfuyuplasma coldseepsis TaxID=2782163 RepID=A0A7L7KU55_9MOLU|nr:hypothetical protein [Xianfuyuplasma coldseepsis]QMS85776.1 hypothetical protein G4Z02_08470 [Xianfuyuplasma coldseepsis]